MKNIKKSDIALIIGAVAVIIIGIFAVSSKSKFDKPVTVEGEAGLREVTYAEYEEAINSEKPFVVMIGSDDCAHCKNFQPIMEKVAADKKIPVMYLKLNNLSDEDQSKVSESNNYLKKKNWGTPTTLVLQGKEVVDYLAGETTEDELTDFLKENVKVSKEDQSKETEE